jgi:hypothetical protein
MLPVTFPDNLQQAQTAPLTLSGDLLHLPTQLVVGARSLVRIRARVPDHCAMPIRAINGDRVCQSGSCRLLSMFPLRNLYTLRSGAGAAYTNGTASRQGPSMG